MKKANTKTERAAKHLTLSKETIRLLGTQELGRVVGKCYDTLVHPCTVENDSANGCISGNLC